MGAGKPGKNKEGFLKKNGVNDDFEGQEIVSFCDEKKRKDST